MLWGWTGTPRFRWATIHLLESSSRLLRLMWTIFMGFLLFFGCLYGLMRLMRVLLEAQYRRHVYLITTTISSIMNPNILTIILILTITVIAFISHCLLLHLCQLCFLLVQVQTEWSTWVAVEPCCIGVDLVLGGWWLGVKITGLDRLWWLRLCWRLVKSWLFLVWVLVSERREGCEIWEFVVQQLKIKIPK